MITELSKIIFIFEMIIGISSLLLTSPYEILQFIEFLLVVFSLIIIPSIIKIEYLEIGNLNSTQ